MPEADSLTQEELDAVRSDREAQQWQAGTRALEAAPIHGAPSTRAISDAAFDLIVEFEVSGEALYTARYRRPTWPQEASGVTIGIGYDVGYATRGELHGDWDGAIPPAAVTALEAALGVTGAPAQALANTLAATVDVPWGAAIAVHRGKVIPRWTGLTERALPNTAGLSAGQLGALVSLTYNRGTSYGSDGDRYKEMRDIRAHMAASAFAAVPGDIRAMKRLWPTVPGLQTRREREARLFEAG